jgi:hypothetical protein
VSFLNLQRAVGGLGKALVPAAFAADRFLSDGLLLALVRKSAIAEGHGQGDGYRFLWWVQLDVLGETPI